MWGIIHGIQRVLLERWKDVALWKPLRQNQTSIFRFCHDNCHCFSDNYHNLIIEITNVVIKVINPPLMLNWHQRQLFTSRLELFGGIIRSWNTKISKWSTTEFYDGFFFNRINDCFGSQWSSHNPVHCVTSNAFLKKGTHTSAQFWMVRWTS